MFKKLSCVFNLMPPAIIVTIIATLLIIPVMVQQSAAQALNVWSSHGPNADVRKVVVDPIGLSTIYAGTSQGVFKSVNGGGSWTSANQGLDNIDIHGLAIDPQNSNILYAGTSNGMFKTVNGGTNWNLTLSGVVTDISVAANNSGIVYAATGDGIFVSPDRGASWNSRPSPDQIAALNLLVVDAQNPNIVFAAFDNYKDFFSTVHKSTNGGASWSVFYYQDGGLITHDLKIDTANSNIIFASTYFGVYKSTNGGASWGVRGAPGANGAGTLAIDTYDHHTLYASGGYENNIGVYKSTDDGATWNAYNNGLTNLQVSSLSFDSMGRFLYAATSTGVFSVRVRLRGKNPIVTAGDTKGVPRP